MSDRYGKPGGKMWILHQAGLIERFCYDDMDPNPDDPNDTDYVPGNQTRRNTVASKNSRNETNQSSGSSSEFSPRSSSGSSSGWPSGCTSDW